MSTVMERAKLLVEFLGQVMGPDCEVVLQDVKAKKIIAIANGEVSGRKVNSPLTDLALQVIASSAWKNEHYQLNYAGMTSTGKILKSSTFFIKERGQLTGMLCINIDTSRYKELSDQILKLGGLGNLLDDSEPNAKSSMDDASERSSSFTDPVSFDQAYAAHGTRDRHTSQNTTTKNSSPIEVFSNSMNDIVQNTIAQCLHEKGDIEVSRLTQDEKLDIIKDLDKKGVFLLKGAISDVSVHLGCSDASIYRYLSKLQKQY